MRAPALLLASVLILSSLFCLVAPAKNAGSFMATTYNHTETLYDVQRIVTTRYSDEFIVQEGLYEYLDHFQFGYYVGDELTFSPDNHLQEGWGTTISQMFFYDLDHVVTFGRQNDRVDGVVAILWNNTGWDAENGWYQWAPEEYLYIAFGGVEDSNGNVFLTASETMWPDAWMLAYTINGTGVDLALVDGSGSSFSTPVLNDTVYSYSTGHDVGVYPNSLLITDYGLACLLWDIDTSSFYTSIYSIEVNSTAIILSDLAFSTNLEDPASFYCAVFPNSFNHSFAWILANMYSDIDDRLVILDRTNFTWNTTIPKIGTYMVPYPSGILDSANNTRVWDSADYIYKVDEHRAAISVPLYYLPISDMIMYDIASGNTHHFYFLHYWHSMYAGFTADHTSGMPPLTVHFTDLSEGSPVGWEWAFKYPALEAFSNDQNPSYTYTSPGYYSVMLFAWNPLCNETITKVHYITVFDTNVTADFVGEPLNGEAPLTVQFSDMSLGVVEYWSWAFGDGQTSTEQNPSHTYENKGNYTVLLYVSNPYNHDLLVKENYIHVTGQGLQPAIALGGNWIWILILIAVGIVIYIFSKVMGH